MWFLTVGTCAVLCWLTLSFNSLYLHFKPDFNFDDFCFAQSPYEVIVINGTSHCDDMRQSLPTDSPQLKMAREHIADILAQWILT